MFFGTIMTSSNAGTASTGFAATATHNTITLNRTTTGSVVLGETIDMTDVAAGKWLVFGQVMTSTAGATPFSHT